MTHQCQINEMMELACGTGVSELDEGCDTSHCSSEGLQVCRPRQATAGYRVLGVAARV